MGKYYRSVIKLILGQGKKTYFIIKDYLKICTFNISMVFILICVCTNPGVCVLSCFCCVQLNSILELWLKKVLQTWERNKTKQNKTVFASKVD